VDEKIKEIESLFKSSAFLISKSMKLSPNILKSIKIIQISISQGNKIIIFGNGGSAADAQHIAAELIGRFKHERKSLPAIALSTDSSIVTSLSNDYSFDIIFKRQCEGLVKSGDVVIGISTSGNSKNVENGLLTAKKMGAKTIAMLGNKGGSIKKIVDLPIIVDSSSTSQIQEVHRVIYHIICEHVEKYFKMND
jgi:D-sedoheptulose 7-phosphate isomerase